MNYKRQIDSLACLAALSASLAEDKNTNKIIIIDDKNKYKFNLSLCQVRKLVHPIFDFVLNLLVHILD
jgi:hypothetical protein